MTYKIKNRLITFLVILSSLIGLSACGDDVDSGPIVVERKAEEKVAKKIKAEAQKHRENELAYTYDAVSRRDPFKTYFDELEVSTFNDQAKTDLERIELDSIKLVGVVTGIATPMAMVEDTAGLGYTIRVGSKVGKHRGQVKSIRRLEVVIQEEFRDYTGKIIPVYKTLKMSEEEGSK